MRGWPSDSPKDSLIFVVCLCEEENENKKTQCVCARRSKLSKAETKQTRHAQISLYRTQGEKDKEGREGRCGLTGKNNERPPREVRESERVSEAVGWVAGRALSRSPSGCDEPALFFFLTCVFFGGWVELTQSGALSSPARTGG